MARDDVGAAWRREVNVGAQEVEAATRRALAELWAEDGRCAHADVAALAGLSLDLLALAAPPELLEQAHLCALERVGDAEACFGVAAAYASEPPPAPPLGLAAHDDDEVTFASLAAAQTSVAVDSEVAARSAREGHASATDAGLRAVLSQVGATASAKASLALAVVAFCVAGGGERADEAVHAALARASQEPASGRDAGLELDVLIRHGRVGSLRRGEIRRQAAKDIAERLPRRAE